MLKYSWTHNEECGIGKLNPHKAYLDQVRQRKAASHLHDELVRIDGRTGLRALVNEEKVLRATGVRNWGDP